MRRLTLFAIILAAPLLSHRAAATVMLKLELPQLVGRADVIFVGKVARLDSHWTEDGKRIVTDATFEVVEDVRGAPTTRPVVVRTMGGVINGMGMRVYGSPQFQVGQEALLFTDLRQGHRYVTGMSQGVFRVVRDQQGRRRVQGSSAGAMLARRSKSGRLEAVHEPSPAPEALETFVVRVRQTMASCAKERARCHAQ